MFSGLYLELPLETVLAKCNTHLFRVVWAREDEVDHRRGLGSADTGRQRLSNPLPPAPAPQVLHPLHSRLLEPLPSPEKISLL